MKKTLRLSKNTKGTWTPAPKTPEGALEAPAKKNTPTTTATLAQTTVTTSYARGALTGFKGRSPLNRLLFRSAPLSERMFFRGLRPLYPRLGSGYQTTPTRPWTPAQKTHEGPLGALAPKKPFCSAKPSNQRGVTMIELVITLLVVAITAFVLHPILTEGLRAWHSIDDKTRLTSEANAVWLYLGTRLSQDSQITVAEDTQMGFTTSGNTYVLSTVPDANGYTLVITQNGGTPQKLASGLAQLESPTRPGLAFSYYDRDGNRTSTPSAVIRVDLSLSLQGKREVYPFQSFLGIESGTLQVE